MLAVLLLPGALRAFIPALIGRSALAMGGLALLLAVEGSTGSYSQAGFATAAFGIANVVAAPWRARTVDRFGQRIALTTMAAAQAGGFIALALALAAKAGGRGVADVWFLVLSAVVGLTAPPLGAAMRTIWASLTEPGSQRTRAFSIDAVCEELLFVGGPVIITAVIVASSPGVGLWVTAAAVFLGTAAMTSSTSSRVLRGTGGGVARGERPLRRPGFARVLIVLLGVGAVLGVAEIAAPAVAAQRDAVAASGWLLAAFAGGSALGGFLYGQLDLRAGIAKRLFALCACMGLAAVLVSRLDALGLFAFAAGLALVGLFLAPSLVTGYLIADTIVPESSRTEASTWINTAVNLGASLASAAAGLVIDRSGTWLALLLVGVIALALAPAVPFTRLRETEPAGP